MHHTVTASRRAELVARRPLVLLPWEGASFPHPWRADARPRCALSALWRSKRRKIPERNGNMVWLAFVAFLSVAGNVPAQVASRLHVGATEQSAAMATMERSVANGRFDSRRTFEWTNDGNDIGRADTASHSNTCHAIRVGALIGGGLGLTGGVIADATQSGHTKIYGIAPLGRLIVGTFVGALTSGLAETTHSH